MSQRALLTQTVNEIVKLLIDAHNQKKDVNLNRLKCVVSIFLHSQVRPTVNL